MLFTFQIIYRSYVRITNTEGLLKYRDLNVLFCQTIIKLGTDKLTTVHVIGFISYIETYSFPIKNIKAMKKNQV